MTQVAMARPGWLEALPRQDGFVCISEARRFAHDEEKYDAQYASDPGNMQVGAGLVELLKQFGADLSGPALEIGCGTGLLSLGFAAKSPYPLTILTDPSPAFLRITQRKVRGAGFSEDRLCYAVLMGEELDRLPAASLSLIVLRSTLHHVLDVDAFIASAARALKPGGVLTFEEPCLEGYVLMGAMAQFLPAVAKGAGTPLTEAQLGHVDLFVRSMAFYARRDLDKSKAEDKHLFRVDELMRSGATCGVEFDFKSNRTYESFLGEPGADPVFFERFFRSYVKYCMSWPDDLMAVFDRNMPDFCKFVAESSRGGSGPYLHGVFVGRKQ
jgi:ubiquinone/menaquinone biosynthesis C-methylase UbiE